MFNTKIQEITKSLTHHVINQRKILNINQNEHKKIKQTVKNEKLQQNKETFERIKHNVSLQHRRGFWSQSRKQVLRVASALPIKDQVFYLDKQSFLDAINLRYGIGLLKLPMHCVSGSTFTIEHALSCKTGGFISIRHNELRDTTADLLSEICKDVTLEPKLTNLAVEKFAKRSANTQDDARVDVSARGFWARGSKAFMDIRVFNPLAKTSSSQSLSAAYRKK